MTVDGEKTTDVKTLYAPEDFAVEGKMVRRGKKNYKRVVV